MKKDLVITVRMTLVTLAFTGILYPLLVTGLARVLFPHRAAGSLLHLEGRLVGSELIGQRFTKPEYFQGRHSAAGSEGYDALASSGSNLGVTSQELHDRVAADVTRLERKNPQAPGPVPEELVTASASGLDPHLSPAAALWQAPRVAAARGVPVGEIESLIRERTEPRTWGIFGEPRVNVLLLNLALDERYNGGGLSNPPR